MDFIFVADVFVEDGLLGGGELNNDELCKILVAQGHSVKKINSHLVHPDYLKANSESCYIIGNFLNLSGVAYHFIKKNLRYIIYEHDHKYMMSRNPAQYENFIAPPEQVVHEELYSSALGVMCQSKFHAEIVKKNLQLDNIFNLSGNLWSENILDYIETLGESEKQDRYSIMESPILHKNASGAKRYCAIKNLDCVSIPSMGYKEFLSELSKNEHFVFFPQTPETFSRVVVEARMMGCKVVTNNLVGAVSEEWFELKGSELIDKMRYRRQTIPTMVMERFEK